jgi:hypothetical protein
LSPGRVVEITKDNHLNAEEDILHLYKRINHQAYNPVIHQWWVSIQPPLRMESAWAAPDLNFLTKVSNRK